MAWGFVFLVCFVVLILEITPQLRILSSLCRLVEKRNMVERDFEVVNLVRFSIFIQGAHFYIFSLYLRYKAAVKADPLCYEVCIEC